MKRNWILTSLLLLLVLIIYFAGCKHDPEDMVINPSDTSHPNPPTPPPVHPCDPDTVYFNKDLMPLFASSCAQSGCHDATSAQEGVILTDYNHVITTGDIKPGNPGDSKIYEVITKTDPDDIMPPPPNNPLTPVQIALIEKWILQGAQNLTCDDDCDTLNVTYTGTIAPALNLYCLGCHNNGGPQGGLSLEGYSNVQAVALDNRLLGVIRWEAGYPKMPKNSNKLPDCIIRQFEIWIANGAQNNK